MPVFRAFLHISFRVPSKGAPLPPGSPNRAPIEGDALFPEPSSNYFSKFLVNTPPPTRFTHPLIKTKFHLSLKVPGKGPPSMFPPTGSLWREMLHLQGQWFIHSFISLKSPQLRSPPTKCGENMRSPSTKPHVAGRPTYNGVWPDSPRGSFTTLLPLPQCHTAFSMIPSTLAWVDESPVRQRVL